MLQLLFADMAEKTSSQSELHKNHRARVKNNVAENGFAQLEDHRFLELLLFYSIPRIDTNETAHLLLNEFGSLERVVTADIKSLMSVKGVGRETALFLSACGELVGRVLAQRQKAQTVCDTEKAIVDFAASLYAENGKEQCFVIFFDDNMRYLGHCLHSEGDAFSTDCNLRLITDIALKYQSSVIVLTHCHPKGDAQPSAADTDATRSVAVHLRKMGILLADHIIFGKKDGSVYSMRDDERFTKFFY